MVKQEPPLPAWAEEMRDAYKRGIAYCFILHGPGVTDYVEPRNIWLRESLFSAWQETFHTVVHYSLATKVRFPTREVTDDEGKVREIAPARDAFVKEMWPGTKAEQVDALLATQFKDPVSSVGHFDRALRLSVAEGGDQKFMGLVIDLVEYLAPDRDLQMTDRLVVSVLEHWGRDLDITAAGNVVVLTCRDLSDVNIRLRSSDARYYPIEIPVPNDADRLAYINWLWSQPLPSWKYEKGLDALRFSKLTAGLSRVGIEDIAYKANGATLRAADVAERKNVIIRTEYSDVIEMLEPVTGFEGVGGYDYLKRAFEQQIIAPMHAGLKSDWSSVLLMGPPGTGKTWIAQALAKEIEVPAIALNFGRQKSRFVGDTEKNVRRAFGLIRAIGECVVFIDEIDTAIPSRDSADTDSGVSRGILSALLLFMSDKSIKGRVIIIAATNRPDNIDAALKRFGRFDAKIPLVAPDEAGRINILLTHNELLGLGASLQAIENAGAKAVFEIVDPNNETIKWPIGFTGAELEEIVRKARSFVKHQAMLPDDALAKAVDDIRPDTLSTLNHTILALQECNDLSLLPPEYAKRIDAVRERQRLMERAEPYRPKEATRRLS